MVSVPIALVEHFLLGRANPGELQRFTQDAGVVADVWMRFAEDLSQPQRVLLSPIDGVPAVEAAAVLHEALRIYRSKGAGRVDNRRVDPLQKGIPDSRRKASVAALESFVAATVYFDELVRIVLPLTQWWASKDLDAIQGLDGPRTSLRDSLVQYVSDRLGGGLQGAPRPKLAAEPGVPRPLRHAAGLKVLEAGYIVALIGLFAAIAENPDIVPIDSQAFTGETNITGWSAVYAETIAKAAVREVGNPAWEAIKAALAPLETPAWKPAPRSIIQRVFLNRESHLADAEAICTIKGDAADRVFNISCASLTWAIIDCGIAAKHPAFDEFKIGPDGVRTRTRQSRVRHTYDLTLIDRIRNFDLTASDEDERAMVIDAIIKDLLELPGSRAANFEAVASDSLQTIAEQLHRRLLPDWSLIEPLIRIEADDGEGLRSDHGTHVAGILAGDWRAPAPQAPLGAPESVVLQGVCPDIALYDLRVIHPYSMKNTEFAVIAALEFVRYLNSRASGPPLIHGVNISLSIPHEVRNYGCGVTPICVACDDLVQSGVVVVAAAGNRGWNERELGFGNFVFCSITDPGNAQRVITVGATHRLKPHTYGVSYFSSRGPTGDGRVKPDLVAPGEKIRGPIRNGADDELDGTSMAAPFVSGAAAMLMARNREMIGQPERIKALLCDSATDLGRERYFQGHGLVDVLRALQSL